MKATGKIKQYRKGEKDRADRIGIAINKNSGKSARNIRNNLPGDSDLTRSNSISPAKRACWMGSVMVPSLFT
jgi:hypothetical protein